MFEVGFSEIVLILGLALLVLGPEKLPGLAQKVGRWTGRARAMARQLRTQLEQEVTVEEMSRSRPMQAPAQTDPAAHPEPSSSPHAESHTHNETHHESADTASAPHAHTVSSETAIPPAAQPSAAAKPSNE